MKLTFDVSEDVRSEEGHNEYGHRQRAVGEKLAFTSVQERPADTHQQRTITTSIASPNANYRPIN